MTQFEEMNLRQPPCALDAEQSVLGGLMLDSSALSKIADWLTENDFFESRNRLLFRAISNLVEAGTPCDAITLSDWLADNSLAELVGISYPLELANTTPSAANITAYAEIVAEKARLRALMDRGAEIVSAASSVGADSSAIAAKALHELTTLTAAKSRGGLVPVKPIMKVVFAEMVARYERGPGLLGLPTPWHKLNDVTKGLRDGVLYIIGARPSMGKSIFGGNLACFTALRGERVAWFSAEMTAQECMSRAIAAHGNIPFDWVEQPSNNDADAELYWSLQTQIMTELTASPLLIDDTPAIRIEQVMARARREHMRKPLRLIVIDHMHDMGTDPKAEVRHEYGRIAQGAKTLAKELNCPVVLLAQLNRNLSSRGDKRPQLTDLRESGEIEQKADVILFLHREDYYGDTHLKGVVELIPAKGRNIRIGETVHLANRFDRMRLDDWDGPLPEPEAKPASESGRGYHYGKPRTSRIGAAA